LAVGGGGTEIISCEVAIQLIMSRAAISPLKPGNTNFPALLMG
jgi:hypothetical protein